MHEIYQPLQEVFDLQPLTRYFGSSCGVSEQGRAGILCLQLPAHYREAHHSQTDTFDKVIPDQINEGAAFLAAWAWNVSEMPAGAPALSRAKRVNGLKPSSPEATAETPRPPRPKGATTYLTPGI